MSSNVVKVFLFGSILCLAALFGNRVAVGQVNRGAFCNTTDCNKLGIRKGLDCPEGLCNFKTSKGTVAFCDVPSKDGCTYKTETNQCTGGDCDSYPGVECKSLNYYKCP
jgi:hypothetical protein